MLRLFFLLNLFLLNLFACRGGYDSCIQKVIDSNAIVNQTLQIPIIKNQRLLFATQTPNTKIIKFNPFLSLYIIEDRQKFKYPFKINEHLSLGTACVNEKIATEGKIVKKQIGLNRFATYNEALLVPSILTNSCCGLEGIVTPHGIIQKEYIKRFMHMKKSSYSDIGIRVKDTKKGVIVTCSDPFMKNNPFKKDDIIIKYDSKKVTKSSLLMRSILFSKMGAIHKIKVKRDSKILEFIIKSTKRYGGGFISDTFLEQKGIYFNNDLTIKQIIKSQKEYGLKIGDKLIQVNNKKVKNFKDIRIGISDFKYFASLLFERNGFQFFINIQ